MPSRIISCLGRMTMLSKRTEAVINSSALLPKPVLSLIPNNIGLTIRCATISFCVASALKNWYCSAASDSCTGSTVAARSLLSLNARMNLPEFELPLNFVAICCSMLLRSSSLGTPLLKLINIEGARPF